jgi:thioredoxin-related protein
MKKIILTLLTLLSISSNAADWQTDFKSAQRLALATNRFILIDFWATWCGPCKKMDQDTWSDKETEELLKDFVLVKVDIDAEKSFANQYGINSIPNMFIVDANGKTLTSFSGYKSPLDLKSAVKDYLLNTEFLSTELINVYKNADFNNLTSLIRKYYVYSLYADKKITLDIIKLNGEYIDDAKKKLDKKSSTYALELQKFELLDLYEYAYKKKFEKLEKKLNEKFTDESKINPSIGNLYKFLKYVSLKGNNKPEFNAFVEELKKDENLTVIEKGEEIFAVRVNEVTKESK